MSLPILNAQPSPDVDSLLRFFLKTERHWTEHLAEETVLDVGSAFINPQLDQYPDANRVLDASLPQGMSPQDAVAEVESHFASAGVKCLRWVMNPSSPIESRRPLIDHLLQTGHRGVATHVYYMNRMPQSPIAQVSGLKIIPARASFRHARELAEESERTLAQPQLADAAVLHLDDPHWDAVLALRDGRAIATGGVLAVGEIGRIDDLYVTESLRRQHIGQTILSRVLESCARSQFRHITLCCGPENTAAIAMYVKFGFRKIGEIVSYVAS